MESKKNRKIELYMDAGAWMRLAKTVLAHTYTALGKVMPNSEVYRMHTAIDILTKLSSKCEDRMYFEHKEIGDDYMAVFYGTPNTCRNTEVDDEQIERMKMFVEGLFEK